MNKGCAFLEVCVRVVFAMRVGGNRRAQYCIMHQRVENMDK